MATRKQRRRRAKEQRHDYVWVDDEGNELEPDEVSQTGTDGRAREPSARRVRNVQAPSWRRSFRRGLIFAPIMFATVFLLSPSLPLVTKVTQTLFIVAVFVPFSYFLDQVFHRSFQRRAARGGRAGGRRGS
jgi:hypothetical protein